MVCVLFAIAALVPAGPCGCASGAQPFGRFKPTSRPRELPANERIVRACTRYGLSGTEVYERSGDDFRSDTTEGVFKSAYASVGGVERQQNESRQCIFRSGDVARPAATPGPGIPSRATATKRTTRPNDQNMASVFASAALECAGRSSEPPWCLATRAAIAMIVSIGFTPLACGKIDASATSRFS
jgi:hypothetical protein